jgi:hypothetical protein
MNFISATVSLSLNSPADGYVSPRVNVSFDCSATSSPEYMTNLSLWINSTGIWEINKTINFLNSSNKDAFDDGGTVLNTTLWEIYESGCAYGSPCFYGSYNFRDQVPPPPDGYMRLLNVMYSGAGCMQNQYAAIKSKQNFNDGKFYNITFNMSNYANGPTFRISIVNQSLSGVNWVGFACGGFNDISRDTLYTLTYQIVPTNNEYVLSINPNGTMRLYRGGVLNSTITTTKSEWYLLFDTLGGCVYCPNIQTYAHIFNYNVTSLGKQNTNLFSELFNQNFSKGDIFKWNCGVTDDIGFTTFATSNRTFSIDNVAPFINITYPYGTLSYAFVGQNLIFNWTVNDTGILDSCWYNYNGTIISVNCNQNYSTIILTELKSLTFYANDTANNLGSYTTNWNYSTIEHSFTHQESAYETETQSFILNVSSDTITSAYLYYNGTSHQGSVDNSSSPGNNIVSVSFDTPIVTGITTKTFYWILNTASGPYTTTTHSQIVNPIVFAYCNATNNISFINFSYKDEIGDFFINATVYQSTFNYWLGQGSVTKSYFYSTPFFFGSALPNHDFCFTPSNKSILLNYIYKATNSPVYTLRTFNSIINITTTNASHQIILYLIQAADGASSTIQISDSTSGNVIQNARVTITTVINGVTTVIGDGYTDAAGTVSNYLSSTSAYTITASKPGCGSNTQTIVPVGSYNMQLNCAGNMPKYSSQIDGVTYQRLPAEGVNRYPGLINYSYWVSSALNPIVAARFDLLDLERNVLASNISYPGNNSYCNTSSCLLTLQYLVRSGDNVKGAYYINLGNTTNNTWVLLEGDAYWRYIAINSNNSQQAFTKFVVNANAFFDIWGSQNVNCIVYKTNSTCAVVPECKWVSQSYNETAWHWVGPVYTAYQRTVDNSMCVLRDDINKAEFNRIIIIFFLLVIVLFIMGKSIGYEMTNPGSFVAYLTIVIIILSVAGFFTYQGLTPWPWFNQYIYAFICLEFSIGYNLAIVRRYSV